jgi:hypothetical protein
LQKNAARRLDWDQFFAHPYLTPENLSRSTNMLPRADGRAAVPEVKPPTPQVPSHPVQQPELPQAPQPQPIKEVEVAPPVGQSDSSLISENAWIQNFVSFTLHGLIFPLYIKPASFVGEVKAMLGEYLLTSCSNLSAGVVHVPATSQLLITAEGQILQDSLRMEAYRLNESPTHLFVFDDRMLKVVSSKLLLSHLYQAGGEELPPYEFVEFSVELPAPTLTPHNPSQAPIEVLVQHQHDYQAKQEFVQMIMEIVGAMAPAVSRCVSQNDQQLAAFKVCVTTITRSWLQAIRNHLTESLRCTEQRLKSIALLVRAQRSETSSLSGHQREILASVCALCSLLSNTVAEICGSPCRASS